MKKRFMFIRSKLRKIKPLRTVYRKWVTYQEDRTYKKLSSFTEISQFLEYVQSVQYEYFLNYYAQSHERRKIFQSVYQKLNLQLKDSSFLDIGPGIGDSLDVAREFGAKKIEFVDRDPYFLVYNQLKGYVGYKLNYFEPQGLTPLLPNKYNIILSKGSLNSDRFTRRESDIIPLEILLDQFDDLASNHIIISPTFDPPYTCKDVEAFRQSWFTKTMLDYNYEIKVIEGFNHPERFPLTFYKQK